MARFNSIRHDDELLEVTPESTRFRKRILDPNDRNRERKRKEALSVA
jgi:GTP-binding protein